MQGLLLYRNGIYPNGLLFAQQAISPIPGMPVLGQDLVPPQFWGPPSDLEQAPLRQGWLLHWALGLWGLWR